MVFSDRLRTANNGTTVSFAVPVIDKLAQLFASRFQDQSTSRHEDMVGDHATFDQTRSSDDSESSSDTSKPLLIQKTPEVRLHVCS